MFPDAYGRGDVGGNCDLMKVSEDLQDYGLEDEDPAARLPEALGTKLEEVGLKCDDCDLESAER